MSEDSVLITVEDLLPFLDGEVNEVRAQAMIDDALALATKAAPCLGAARITDLDDVGRAAAKAVLRGAILRWYDFSGSGALASHSMAAGPYSETQTFDNRQTRRTLFWPTEIEELQSICAGEQDITGAYSIDLTPSGAMDRFRDSRYF